MGLPRGGRGGRRGRARTRARWRGAERCGGSSGDRRSRALRRDAGGAARAGAHRAGPGQAGYTPLHFAARDGRLEVAEKLLAAGADVGATDDVRAPRAGEGVAGFSFYIRSVLGSALFCFSLSLFMVCGCGSLLRRERGEGGGRGARRAGAG